MAALEAYPAEDKNHTTINDGKTFVVKAGTEFKVLATNQLGERITASPAITGNWLIYRTGSHLYCIGEN